MLFRSGLTTAGLTRLAAPATRQVARVTGVEEAAALARQAAAAPFAERTAAKQAARVQQAYERAPQIEAAQDAYQLGIMLNPAKSNPTPGARGRVVAAGGDTAVDYSAAKFNEKRVNAIAREELGLPPTATLGDDAIDTALDRKSTRLNSSHT